MNAPGKINTDTSKFNIVISPATMVDPSEMINVLTTNELLAISFVKYITTGILSPFEVSRILQQIQYIPSLDYLKKNDDITEEQTYETNNNYESSEESEESDIEKYCNQAALQPSKAQYNSNVSLSDTNGYIIRTNSANDPLRPSYQLGILEGSTTKTIRKLVKHKDEGFFSLWKGHFLNWVYEILHVLIQPSIEGIINRTFDLYDETLPLIQMDKVMPNLTSLVASYTITGFILSPIELVRVRMIAQTSNPYYKKYKNSWHGIKTIAKEEGLSSIYFGYNLVPTLLYHSVIPLLKNSNRLVIERLLGISASKQPGKYALCELGLSSLELLISFPLETVRRRLQCQINPKIMNHSTNYSTKVAIRRTRYNGMIDCIKSIIKEEGGDAIEKKKKKNNETDSSNEDETQENKNENKKIINKYYQKMNKNIKKVKGLYRGIDLMFWTNVVILGFNILNEIEIVD
ncbi:mitochondrial carrier [Anaeromyces robustus]|uniref:Mitochondrial carrier n=1 Tax=Anaeromyces robustus TaxID=1754192 RepID=A0A1Y1XN56_9FUNG|nr:mitochondrial carrier [Anaeromyces robustus]|eukprot:ORX87153.1 mitochondrial carrier [Anaeromyces robustus]